uniref:Uncharacterized protein n=1 Tax=Anguilla anguilla TaxID=7936 RepID=A0A0E9RTD5_ANGAN
MVSKVTYCMFKISIYLFCFFATECDTILCL